MIKVIIKAVLSILFLAISALLHEYLILKFPDASGGAWLLTLWAGILYYKFA